MLRSFGGVSEHPPDSPPGGIAAAKPPLGRQPRHGLDLPGEPTGSWLAGRVRVLAREKIGLTLGLTALFAAGWWTIPRYLVGEVHTLPLTALERRLPFVEGFVYVYLSIGLFMPLGPYLTVARAGLARHAAGFLLLTLLSFLGFVLYPVVLPPPDATPATLLYRLLVADTRLNNLPSLHAGYTVYSLLYWEHLLPEIPGRTVRSAAAVAIGSWAGLILVSILLIKQHYLIDVIAGVAAGALSYAVAFPGRLAGEALGLRPFHPSLETNR